MRPFPPLTLSTLAKHFSDESEAYQLVERLRWPRGVVCPHCGTKGEAYFLKPRNGLRKTRRGIPTYRRVWKCGACRKQFSVLVGTIFGDSHIPLSKWLLAIHMMCAGKNGVSAFELHRTLGIMHKSAWFMAQRIRHAMARPPLVNKLRGTVEADETYIGGKVRGKQGRGDNKTPVLTLVERGGEARSQAMNRLTGEDVGKVLYGHIDRGANLMTDSAAFYKTIGPQFARHEAVNHSAGEYVRGVAHVNTAENYFGQLKRSVDGTYHHVSERHLDRYLAEFDFRYNTRKMSDGDRTELAIAQSGGKRLTYNGPVSTKP